MGAHARRLEREQQAREAEQPPTPAPPSAEANTWPDLPGDPTQLRLDGPTFEEYVNAGYRPELYPPVGYAVRASLVLSLYRKLTGPTVDEPESVQEPAAVSQEPPTIAAQEEPVEDEASVRQLDPGDVLDGPLPPFAGPGKE